MSGRRQISKGIGLLLTAGFLLNFAWFPACAAPEWPSDTGIMAAAGIAVDEQSGAVLFGQNIHEPYAPASITKLLTALVVAENASLDEVVTFSHDAVYNVESGSGNSLALEEGDQLTVRDCLHALLLRSSNQAANALAEHVAGSRDAFVDMMNEKIAELGCTESHFANPSGLNDTEQYVTAYDMALIARAAFANETVLAVDSARRYTLPATIKNPEGLPIAMEHKILAATDPSSQYYLEGAVGGKTGYTSIAGNTLVTYAVRDGRGVISVILKGTQPQYYLDGKALIEFGFASFENIRIADHETLVQELDMIETETGVYEQADFYLDEDAVLTVPRGASFTDTVRSYTLNPEGNHPENALAYLEYTYNDRKVGSAYIYAKNLHISTEPLSVAVLETETEAETGTADGENDGEAEGSGSFVWVMLLVGTAVLAGTACAVYVIWSRKKKEQAAAALRREKRLQRISELGYSREEFERLLNERRSSWDKKKR